jgi:hypothetical protein
MNVVKLARAGAAVLGAAMIIFAVYATPIVWNEPRTMWTIMLLWPLAIGGIRMLRVAVTGDANALRKIEERSAQVRERREAYHTGNDDHG